MYQREFIEFKTDKGYRLRGVFYRPETQIPAPCIIMTHGFSALKEQGLMQFAERFAEAQFCVLLYDNRNFGESEGDCRFEVDPQAQINDYIAAISFVQTLPSVQSDRIGLWGTSFSGGIVLSVAAIEERVRCVVTQVPFVSGHHEMLQQKKPALWSQLAEKYAADHKNREAGYAPAMMPVVATGREEIVVMPQQEAYDFFKQCASWENQVTLRSVENAGNYYPIKSIATIKSTPILFIIATQDTVNTTRLALKAFDETCAPKQCVMIEGHHFTPYEAGFETSVTAAINWFSTYLTAG